ncbi:MAG: RNA-binding cell elongation regulator Jag/EloR [Elusimicrobiota bacterium]
MKEIETEGKTVTIAVENGLKELSLRRDEVEVQVIEEGTAGFLGIGAKPARVHIREKRWAGDEPPAHRPPAKKPAREKPAPKSPRAEQRHVPRPKQGAPSARPRVKQETERSEVDTAKACEAAEGVLKEIFSLAGLGDASVKCLWDKRQCRVQAEVETGDAELLIGNGGRTIEAIQFLVTVIVGRKTGTPTAIQVETQGYWKRIEEKVLAEAEKAVDEVRRTGRVYRFEPMDPALRRLIHRKLVDHPDVETASEGEGSWRKVILKPRSARRTAAETK